VEAGLSCLPAGWGGVPAAAVLLSTILRNHTRAARRPGNRALPAAGHTADRSPHAPGRAREVPRRLSGRTIARGRIVQHDRLGPAGPSAAGHQPDPITSPAVFCCRPTTVQDAGDRPLALSAGPVSRPTDFIECVSRRSETNPELPGRPQGSNPVLLHCRAGLCRTR